MLTKWIVAMSMVPVLVFASTGLFQTSTPAPGQATGGSANVPVSARAILGSGVSSPGGQGLGSVVDLVVDTASLAGQTAASGSGVNTSAQGSGNGGGSGSGQGAPAATPAAAATASPAGQAQGASPSLGNASVASLVHGRGQVVYAVIGFGGVLGIGQTRTAVPWKLLAYQPQQGNFVLDTTAAQLSRAPGFEPPADGGALAPNWDQPLRDYWLNGGSQASSAADCARQQSSVDPVRPSIQPGYWYGLGNANVAGVGAANGFEGNEPGLGLGASRALDDVVSQPAVGTFGDGVTAASDSVVVGCMPPGSPTVAANLAPSRAVSLGTRAANPFFSNGGNQAPAGDPNAANGGTGNDVLASALLGSAVRDANGANAGTLTDMVLQASTSEARAATGTTAAATDSAQATTAATGAATGTDSAAGSTGTPGPGTATAATGTPAATGVATSAAGAVPEATAVVSAPAGARAPANPAATEQAASGPSGEVLYGVVGSGGFLGAGSQTTAVPWRLLTYSGVRILAFNAGAPALQAAPHVNPGTQPANNPGWDRPVQSYWQKAAPSNTGG